MAKGGGVSAGRFWRMSTGKSVDPGSLGFRKVAGGGCRGRLEVVGAARGGEEMGGDFRGG